MRRSLFEQAHARQDMPHQIAAPVMLQNVGAALLGNLAERVAVLERARDGLGQAARFGAIIETVFAGKERPQALDRGLVDQRARTRASAPRNAGGNPTPGPPATRQATT